MTLRIGISGWGSEGDLRPLIALAARLRREGHRPRLALTPIDGTKYEPLCRAIDVPLEIVPREMTFSLEQLVRDANDADFTKLSRAVLDAGFHPYVDIMHAAAADLCATSDVVVGGSSSWYVKAAAIEANVPYVAVGYYPGVVPSRVAPPHGLADWGLFNGLRWVLLRAMFDMAFRKAPAAFYAARGLPKVRHAIPDVLFSERLNLHAASPTLCPPARDWSEIHHVCGEFTMDEDAAAWQPSAALRSFLEGGEPPVLYSLGSMEHMAPARARALVVDAARLTKRRAIVQSKCEDAEGEDGALYFLRWAPHRALVPRCSAVVHHGGAGTTHAVLRAGKPAVVVPFIFEQRLWGKCLEQRGAAFSPLSFWKATPTTLAARVNATLDTDTVAGHTRELATAMRGEDGTGEATRRIESLQRARYRPACAFAPAP